MYCVFRSDSTKWHANVPLKQECKCAASEMHASLKGIFLQILVYRTLISIHCGYKFLILNPVDLQIFHGNIIFYYYYLITTIIITIIIIIIIINIIIFFMQGIYSYISETNYVPRESSVATILLLLFMVLISLVSVLNLL